MIYNFLALCQIYLADVSVEVITSTESIMQVISILFMDCQQWQRLSHEAESAFRKNHPCYFGPCIEIIYDLETGLDWNTAEAWITDWDMRNGVLEVDRWKGFDYNQC